MSTRTLRPRASANVPGLFYFKNYVFDYQLVARFLKNNSKIFYKNYLFKNILWPQLFQRLLQYENTDERT